MTDRSHPQAKRPLVHDQSMHFRVNAALMKAAEARAKTLGMSVGELCRAGLRSQIPELL